MTCSSCLQPEPPGDNVLVVGAGDNRQLDRTSIYVKRKAPKHLVKK